MLHLIKKKWIEILPDQIIFTKIRYRNQHQVDELLIRRIAENRIERIYRLKNVEIPGILSY